jgi:hypothetical protein
MIDFMTPIQDTESEIGERGCHDSVGLKHQLIDAHLHLARTCHIGRGSPASSMENELNLSLPAPPYRHLLQNPNA